MAEKRPADAPAEGDDGDILECIPLGAGQEVGRSCMQMKYKGKTVMVSPRTPAGTCHAQQDHMYQSIDVFDSRDTLTHCLIVLPDKSQFDCEASYVKMRM